MTSNALLQAAGYALFLPLLWWGGNLFCRKVLDACGAKPTPQKDAAELTVEKPRGEEETLKAGRFIGVLERSLVVVGILTARWEVIAGVVALKTAARYKELDTQLQAEYFLIGSQASILWAALATMALLVYDLLLGFHLLPHLKALLVGPQLRAMLVS